MTDTPSTAQPAAPALPKATLLDHIRTVLVLLVFLWIFLTGWHYYNYDNPDIDRALTARYAGRMQALGVKEINITTSTLMRYAPVSGCDLVNVYVDQTGQDQSLGMYLKAASPTFQYVKADLVPSPGGPRVKATYDATASLLSMLSEGAPNTAAAHNIDRELDRVLSSMEWHEPLCEAP